MRHSDARQQQFLALLDQYKDLIVKICYVYSSPAATIDDLYQEIAANIWIGLPGFRGDAKYSTWIYRTAINTCITCQRRDRHSHSRADIEDALIVADDGDESMERLARYRMLHDLISTLLPIDKAIVTMWLDDKPYAEIASVTGLSVANVATRLHRIKDKLSRQAKEQS